jgi:hypothetical protein
VRSGEIIKDRRTKCKEKKSEVRINVEELKGPALEKE